MQARKSDGFMSAYECNAERAEEMHAAKERFYARLLGRKAQAREALAKEKTGGAWFARMSAVMQGQGRYGELGVWVGAGAGFGLSPLASPLYPLADNDPEHSHTERCDTENGHRQGGAGEAFATDELDLHENSLEGSLEGGVEGSLEGSLGASLGLPSPSLDAPSMLTLPTTQQQAAAPLSLRLQAIEAQRCSLQALSQLDPDEYHRSLQGGFGLAGNGSGRASMTASAVASAAASPMASPASPASRKSLSGPGLASRQSFRKAESLKVFLRSC